MGYKTLLISILLFFLAFIPRLYKISNPVADWHSWRQADTAAVTRNFIKEGVTPLYPKFDSLFALNETGAPNPKRYFFAEFPLYNLLTYPFYWFYGVQEIYARLVSIIAASWGTVFLYLLVRRLSSERAAVLAGVFYALLPFNIYYGRVIMPDPLHIMLQILALLLAVVWIEQETGSKIQTSGLDSGKSSGKPQSPHIASHSLLIGGLPLIAGLVLAAALLTKPYALVLAIPIGYLILYRWGWAAFTKRSVYLFGLAALLPFVWWRWHIGHYPEGQFGTSWLFNQGNIRFTGAYFRWLIFERMNRLIFATGGFVLFWLGFIRGRSKQEGWFYYLWLIGVGIFFIVIAKGNVTHDYYQLPLVPIGCIMMAKGFEFLAMYGRGLKHRILNFSVGVVMALLMLGFGWYEVRGFYQINHWEIVEAGRMADQLLPKDAKVIAPYQSDSAFLYQTNRYGWTVGGGLIQGFIEQGATHLVSTTLDADTQSWMDRCQIVAQDPQNQWVIVDLRVCQEAYSQPLLQ